MAEGAGQRKLTEEQHAALKEAFRSLQLDKPGHVSKSELRSALQLIGQIPTKRDMDDYCPDSHGDIDKEDFFTYIEQHVALRSSEDIHRHLCSALAMFGNHDDKTIDVDKFREIMTSGTLGDEPLSHEEADIFLKSLEVNDNKTLDVTKLATLFQE